MKKITPIRHPSGKPIYTVIKTGWNYQRVPNDGPVTPRLQRKEFAQAVGFTAPLIGGDWNRV